MDFTTSVVGSFPRPDWLITAFKDYRTNKISKEELYSNIERAVRETVYEEEKVGLDIITDGEQGRTSFVNFIGEKIPGFQSVHITKLHPDAIKILKEYKTKVPYIRAVPVDYLPEHVDLVSDELERIQRYSTTSIKMTLPSPYLLMWETWNESMTKPYYKKPEDLGYAYVKILREEINRLKDRGVKRIQLDEPMLGNMLEATDEEPDRYRKFFGIINGQKYRGFKEEFKLAQDMVNETVKGITGLEREMHVCHWPNSDSPNYGVGLERYLPEIFNIEVDNLVLECEVPGSGNPLKLVKQYPKNLKIGLGVINVMSGEIENPEHIVQQVERITSYIDPERISLNPDCGFAPGLTHNLFSRETAFRKIESMVKAAHILRDKYN